MKIKTQACNFYDNSKTKKKACDFHDNMKTWIQACDFHETRISILETKISILETKISILETKISILGTTGYDHLFNFNSYMCKITIDAGAVHSPVFVINFKS